MATLCSDIKEKDQHGEDNMFDNKHDEDAWQWIIIISHQLFLRTQYTSWELIEKKTRVNGVTLLMRNLEGKMNGDTDLITKMRK